MSTTTRSRSDYGPAAIELSKLETGAMVPPMRRTVTRLHSNLWCAAVRFVHQVHFDDEMCRQQGWKGVIVPGFLMGNWCLEAVCRMLGPRSVARAISFRMTSVAYLDSPLDVTGEVTAVENVDGEVLVTCAMRVTDEDGQVVTKGSVVVAAPMNLAHT